MSAFGCCVATGRRCTFLPAVGWPGPLSLKKSRLVSVIGRRGLQIVLLLTWAEKEEGLQGDIFARGASVLVVYF